jgi:hypothetical protein
VKVRKTLVTLCLIFSVLGGVTPAAEAHNANRSSPQRITAYDIAEHHETHGDSQWRNGQGTPGHTWLAYQNQARLLNIYLRRLEFARLRQHLVWRWSGVAECESGGNWAANTGNGYYGGIQFLLSTWHSVGGSGYPNQNSPQEQAYRAEILKNRSGLGQWPHCGRYYR